MVLEHSKRRLVLQIASIDNGECFKEDGVYKKKGKFLLENFDQRKSVVAMEDIPSALTLNWDQTAMKIVSSSMEKKGSKRVEVVAADDKRQITAVFACCPVE